MGLGLRENPDGSYTSPADPGEQCYGPTAGPRVSVTRDEARLLGWLARDCRVLEIGTGLGVSTRALAERAKIVVTVDPDPWVHAHVWPEIEDDPKILPVEALPGLDACFDLVFIDGNHREAALERDVAAALKLCRHGLVALHDVAYPGVRQVAERMLPGLVVMPTTHGLGLAWSDG